MVSIGRIFLKTPSQRSFLFRRLAEGKLWTHWTRIERDRKMMNLRRNGHCTVSTLGSSKGHFYIYTMKIQLLSEQVITEPFCLYSVKFLAGLICHEISQWVFRSWLLWLQLCEFLCSQARMVTTALTACSSKALNLEQSESEGPELWRPASLPYPSSSSSS